MFARLRTLPALAFAASLVGVGLAICLVGAAPARAALGGDAASVASDAARMQGSVHAAPLQSVDREEITTDSGMTVREFVNGAGIVFAVTWSGPVVPDLRMLLGANFDSYTRALAARSGNVQRRSVRIATATLVVEQAGHMRAYSGRAYLPAAVPPGIAAGELR
jgi:hypothetical protein